MEAVFGWLQQIFDALLSLFPRRVIVGPTNRLLKYKWDGSVVEKGPGLRWYWPLCTKIDEITVVRQAISDLYPIKFISKENIPCSADASCVYYVHNAEEYATMNYDTESMIREAVSASLCNLLIDTPLEDLKNLEKINEYLTSEVDTDVENFGIELEYVRINSITWIIPLTKID